jgi:hypothetical protein
MQVGDLVTHIDRKDVGVVTKVLQRCLWVFWPDGEIKKYQSDYYLKEVA